MRCPTCGSPRLSETASCVACGAPPVELFGVSHCLSAGTALQNGAFTIEGVLGRGGFGITYRGHDAQLGRTVALKEFFPAGCVRDGTTVQPPSDFPLHDYLKECRHFLDEAQRLARFHHPGIVQVYSVFEENNTAYTVMEFLHGETLAALLERAEGGLGQSRSLTILQKITPALAVVHEKGLLHRDIKPDNIMVALDHETQQERIVLIDFGSARELESNQTRGQSIVLTPGYAPLEQYAGKTRRGAYTDVYALAATLYHMLTGQVPTPAGDRAVGVPLRPARHLNPAIEPQVSQAIQIALEIEIARRPQTVREFMASLFDENAPRTGGDAVFPAVFVSELSGIDSQATLNLTNPTKSTTKPIGQILRSVALSQPPEPLSSIPPCPRAIIKAWQAMPEGEPTDRMVQQRPPRRHFFPANSLDWILSSLASIIIIASSLALFTNATIFDLLNRLIATIK